MKSILSAAIALALIFGISACDKETETFSTAQVETYAPLQPGKYIIYNLDSLVFVKFGTQQEIHRYQVKYEVDAQVSDNLGRPAYRIFRYIRNTSAGNWNPDATFTAVNSGNNLEFVENNLRYLKLVEPISEGYTWKGNRFIDTYTINSDLKYLDGWDYMYQDVNKPKTIGGIAFDSTITVLQRNDSLGLPLTQATQYAEKNVGKEIYATKVGLIYREFVHFEFQRVSNSYTGYGVTYTVVEHN